MLRSSLLGTIAGFILLGVNANASPVREVGCEIQVPGKSPTEIWPILAKLLFKVDAEDSQQHVDLPTGESLLISIDTNQDVSGLLNFDFEVYRSGELPSMSEMLQLSDSEPFVDFRTSAYLIQCHK